MVDIWQSSWRLKGRKTMNLSDRLRSLVWWWFSGLTSHEHSSRPRPSPLTVLLNNLQPNDKVSHHTAKTTQEWQEELRKESKVSAQRTEPQRLTFSELAVILLWSELLWSNEGRQLYNIFQLVAADWWYSQVNQYEVMNHKIRQTFPMLRKMNIFVWRTG